MEDIDAAIVMIILLWNMRPQTGHVKISEITELELNKLIWSVLTQNADVPFW